MKVFAIILSVCLVLASAHYGARGGRRALRRPFRRGFGRVGVAPFRRFNTYSVVRPYGLSPFAGVGMTTFRSGLNGYGTGLGYRSIGGYYGGGFAAPLATMY